MESEGPYTIDEENGQCCVVGPGYQKPGARIIQNGDYWPTRMLQLDMNLAHAKGRKAERERCAKIAEDHALLLNSPGEAAACREVAEMIRGGHDGK